MASAASFALLAACAVTPPEPVCRPIDPAPAADMVELISHGWHTDLGLSAAGLTGDLARFRTVFPGLRVLVVGFGRRTFMTAPVDGPGDFLVGPLPGRGALLVIGLRADPVRAYGEGEVVRLPIDRLGRARLDAFVARSFRRDRTGAPVRIGPGPYPGSLFFAATPTYSLAETCNTWTAAALKEAGLRISDRFVVFASQAIRRADRVPGAEACRLVE